MSIFSRVGDTALGIITNNLNFRLTQHRFVRGSEFVHKYGIHRLVHVETYETAVEAIAREKQLKKWKRDWKIQLIEQNNLEGRDLSDLVM